MADQKTADQNTAVDENRLNALLGRVIGDLGATTAAGNVVVGHRLGLYRALADGPGDRPTSSPTAPRPTPATSPSGCTARRRAATSSTTAATGRFSLSPEQAFAFADPDGPLYLPGAFQLALARCGPSPG